MASELTFGEHNRRAFLQSAGAGVVLAAGFSRRARAAAGETLKVGLIGCGGRGTGAAREALLADPQARLVALADAFQDMMEACAKKMKAAGSGVEDRVDVTPETMFSGFEGYKKVCELCDVVVLAAPPAFRPAHLEAAVAAGCHVFCEKPIAVDAPGVRSVWATCEAAKTKGLNIVSGLCYRYEFKKQETIKRLQDGAIGDFVALQTTYNTGGLWHKGRQDGWTEMEYQVRNWLYFDWLSGDHINEQHIHSLDKIGWLMGDVYPVKATSSGGRAQRTDPKYGNIYDHFNTVYEWENGLRCFSSCRQWESCSTDVSDWVFGTKGVANIQESLIRPAGGEVWKWKGSEPDNMYQNEHNALFGAIRKGEVINNGDYMCKSTMMAIMGRMAAYTGKTISWDDAWNSEERLGPATLAWGDLPTRPVPVPGDMKNRA